MILDKIGQLKPTEINLLEWLYFYLNEYLELIWPHPSRAGFGGRLYITSKEESEFRLITAWTNFQKAVVDNTIEDKEIILEAETDYKETLRIVEALKDTKRGAITRQKIENESYDMQEKLQKISMALTQQGHKLRTESKKK